MKLRILFLMLAVLLVSCNSCKDFKPPDLNTKTQTNFNAPDFEVKLFTREFKKLDLMEWELDAESARYYSESNRYEMTKVRLVYYNKKGGNASILQSDRGIYYESKKNVELISNVYILSTNQTEIRSDHLLWDNETQKLTALPHIQVEIKYKEGNIVRGYGFEADKTLEELTFRSNVTGEGDEDEFEGR